MENPALLTAEIVIIPEIIISAGDHMHIAEHVAMPTQAETVSYPSLASSLLSHGLQFSFRPPQIHPRQTAIALATFVCG
jgi:hypothetical protein